MPYLSNKKEKIQVASDESLVDAGESLGVPFSCTEGNCGTCLVEVLEGMDNFCTPNSQEEMFGLHPNERLLCQTRFKSDVDEDAVSVVKP